MKNALVIAAREFEEKRFVAYAALAFAVLPFLVGVVPIANGKSPREAIVIMAVILASGFTIGLGVITGASFVGRDLSDGRMSFYFSRPIGSASIWFGKLIAGIVLIVGCFGVIAGPSRLVGPIWKSVWDITFRGLAATVLPVAIALFLIAHVIGTFARSRSPLIVFDFAAAVICGLSVRFLLLPLFAGDAAVLVKWLSVSLGIAAVVGIVGGGAWQLERGRTDRRRNHLALSQFLWGTLAVVLLIAAAYVAWVVSAKVTDLTGDVIVSRSTGGPLAVIAGTSKGRSDYRAAFLIDTETGSATRIDSRAEWGVRYTRDGRSAVVPRRAGNFADLVLYTRGKTEPVDTGLTIATGDYFVSDDGGRIATISNQNIVSVYDVAQKRSLASVRLPESLHVQAFFVTPDVLRLYFYGAEGTKIAELDVRSQGLRETGFITSPKHAAFYPDSSAAHMLVKGAREDVLTLSDARTGAPIRTLASGMQVNVARFLRDGRIVVVDGPSSAKVLHILTAEGVTQRDVPLGRSGWTTFAGDDGTRVVLSAQTSRDRSTLMAVDINRGVVERRVETQNWASTSGSDVRPPIAPLRDVFYADSNGRVATWSPATGATRTITGG